MSPLYSEGGLLERWVKTDMTEPPGLAGLGRGLDFILTASGLFLQQPFLVPKKELATPSFCWHRL